MLFYEFDAATREPPPWQPESYKLIARIAAGEGRFNQNSDVDINTEVKSIAVTKKGVYFAFRDQGACISVLAVKVYYITCPAITENFAHFNETPTGREITIIEKQTGVCVKNAESSEPPTYLCKGDGKWTILTSGCKCKVGFEPDYDKQTCTGINFFFQFFFEHNIFKMSNIPLSVCPIGTFRSMEVTKCTACPLNSKATKSGSSYCACVDGYYRHQRDSLHMPCYRPPSKPTNLTLLFMDQTSAILSWNAPQKSTTELYDSKYRSDIVFKVKCPVCNSNVVFIPATETFNDTKLTINNLEPVTTYTIQIHALNSVSYQIYTDIDGNVDGNVSDPQAHSANIYSNSAAAGTSINEPPTEFAEITFTTESAILSMVFNIRIVTITSHEVELAWDNPSEVPIESYEVRWFPKMELDAVNKTTLSTHEQRAHIDNLLENTEYGFQVRCKTANGFGQYSNIIYGQTHQGVSPGNFMHFLRK